jgi:hypothetical protein
MFLFMFLSNQLQLQKDTMNLTERLAQHGITEREDHTLIVPFENRSGFVQVRVQSGRVWMRDLQADGRPAHGEFGEWRGQSLELMSWALQRDTLLAEWLRSRGASVERGGSMATLEVGKSYAPGRKSIEPRVEYSFRGGEHQLLLCLSPLSEDEIAAVRQGQAEFGLLIYGLAIFLLYRFAEAIAWSDAPYSWHRIPPEQRQLPETPKTAEIRAVLSVVLVDAERNVVRALRRGMLSPDFTRALNAAIADQATAPWNPEIFETHLRSAYQSWPTVPQMLNHAIARTSWT